jgi:hypothetical protein
VISPSDCVGGHCEIPYALCVVPLLDVLVISPSDCVCMVSVGRNCGIAR